MNLSIDFVPEKLRQFFHEHPRAALAFSGGCDSAYLLYASAVCGAEVRVCYVQSCFQPAFELNDAKALADQLGVDIHVLPIDVLADADVRKNPANRCYFCKKHIFDAILQSAREGGFDCVIDGTNASDDADDRPGMKALGELQVLSPLRICGITKADVRRLSQAAGLFTWNKPAYACLATRIPAGTEICADDLRRIEHAENILANMGFSDFRVRISGAMARLELTEEQMPLLLRQRTDILRALQPDFQEICLDLRARKGLEI